MNIDSLPGFDLLFGIVCTTVDPSFNNCLFAREFLSGCLLPQFLYAFDLLLRYGLYCRKSIFKGSLEDVDFDVFVFLVFQRVSEKIADVRVSQTVKTDSQFLTVL